MADQRDIGSRPAPAALFSMDAADNAEVVPPDAPRGADEMWSTTAKADEPDPIELDDVDADASHLPPPPPPGWERAAPGWSAAATEDDAWERMAGVHPGEPQANDETFSTAESGETGWSSAPPMSNGGVFSAEPVERGGDIVDEADIEESGPFDASGPAVFASDPPASPFAAPQDPWSSWEPSETARPSVAPPPFGRTDSVFRAPAPDTHQEDDPTDLVAADHHGFAEAVSRLRLDDQRRVRVPLSVCGALLEQGERVVGVVTGQMLGRPAAVVVTQRRVLVVNDRRWQPIVDIYRIGDGLQVRGRHDGHVAALSFADDGHLSMVDGITEVDLAVTLAETIRDPDAPDPSEGTEF